MGESLLDRALILLDDKQRHLILDGHAYTDLWATQRPLTGHWGSGQVFPRMVAKWGMPDVVFGKQDQVEGFTVDKDPNVHPSVVADWAHMPFADGQFVFGYWDPPYIARADPDGGIHYERLDPCLREICRVLRGRLAILHPLIYPNPEGWHRVAVIGVTFGPNKSIRALQVIERDGWESGEPKVCSRKNLDSFSPTPSESLTATGSYGGTP